MYGCGRFRALCDDVLHHLGVVRQGFGTSAARSRNWPNCAASPAARFLFANSIYFRHIHNALFRGLVLRIELERNHEMFECVGTGGEVRRCRPDRCGRGGSHRRPGRPRRQARRIQVVAGGNARGIDAAIADTGCAGAVTPARRRYPRSSWHRRHGSSHRREPRLGRARPPPVPVVFPGPAGLPRRAQPPLADVAATCEQGKNQSS